MNIGTLYIVATPIGNREDITLRALRILSTVPVIACEDTRKTGMLLEYYKKGDKGNGGNKGDEGDKKTKLISFYDEVEERRMPEIIELLKAGNDVALVSDAGTPLISDPGFKLVRECHRQNIPVSPIPGASSITAALSASGMPTDKFTFLGYLPKKEGKRRRVIREIWEIRDRGDSELVKTIVLFETPHRIEKTLQEIKEGLGEIEISIMNELTKIHEKVWKGKISEAIIQFKDQKGEFVIIISLH